MGDSGAHRGETFVSAIILLSGPVGAGKSTVAQELVAAMPRGATDKNFAAASLSENVVGSLARLSPGSR